MPVRFGGRGGAKHAIPTPIKRAMVNKSEMVRSRVRGGQSS
jgi:hypothetical protein